MSPKIALAAGILLATALGTAAALLRQEPPPADAAFALSADDPALGRRTYGRCQACHGVDGRGVPGNYPPLVGSPLLLAADPVPAIEVTLRGAARGQLNGRMPAFPDLADHEVAAVLTWARNQWGNAAPPIDPATVARMRSR